MQRYTPRDNCYPLSTLHFTHRDKVKISGKLFPLSTLISQEELAAIMGLTFRQVCLQFSWYGKPEIEAISQTFWIEEELTDKRSKRGYFSFKYLHSRPDRLLEFLLFTLRPNQVIKHATDNTNIWRVTRPPSLYMKRHYISRKRFFRERLLFWVTAWEESFNSCPGDNAVKSNPSP